MEKSKYLKITLNQKKNTLTFCENPKRVIILDVGKFSINRWVNYWRGDKMFENLFYILCLTGLVDCFYVSLSVKRCLQEI